MNQIQTIYSTTEKPLDRFALTSDDQLEQAIESCHRAYLHWRTVSPERRAAVISKIGKGLQSNKSALARLMTDEMGKLLSHSEQELDLCRE